MCCSWLNITILISTAIDHYFRIQIVIANGPFGPWSSFSLGEWLLRGFFERHSDTKESCTIKAVFHFHRTVANRRGGDECETHLNDNITRYLCYSTFIHKSGPSPSHVYCIFAQLTNSDVLGKLPIRDYWKLLLVDLAKIQYTRDGEVPDLWINVD
jgi:hypothetical protein